jgi:hypothetical protein
MVGSEPGSAGASIVIAGPRAIKGDHPVATNTKTKTKTKSKSKSRLNDFNWEDFRPEWASERIDRISAELEKWNDNLQSRSAKFRKESQKRIDKSVSQIQDELRKLPGVKRAEELRSDLEKRVEQGVEDGVDRVYSTLKLARLDEVKKLEKKVAQLNKKLRALEQQLAA